MAYDKITYGRLPRKKNLVVFCYGFASTPSYICAHHILHKMSFCQAIYILSNYHLVKTFQDPGLVLLGCICTTMDSIGNKVARILRLRLLKNLIKRSGSRLQVMLTLTWSMN